MSFEKELEAALDIVELEQRLEMGWYWGEFDRDSSCGYEIVFYP